MAKKNGYDHVINYNKEDFAKKVLEITNGKGVTVVYDGVGKDTLNGSIECLAIRGMMVSFGNASGPLSDINVPRVIQPKGLYLVRPSMQQYLSTREELDEASKTMFEKISSGKVKIKIGGGNAGHKGLGNIDQKIGKEYIRLRIGINHTGSKKLVSS